ncbi:hypothetical protein EJB05_34008, partial [Eragrostis curvula]
MARRSKVKIQWIADRRARQQTFLKRRHTLLEKARELSILCDVPAAVVVYGGPGREADPPATWPPAPEATAILQRYPNLSDSSKQKVDLEDFLRERVEMRRKKLGNMKLANRAREVNLVLDELSLGRRRSLDDLPDDLVADVKAEVQRRMMEISSRMEVLMAAPEPPMVPPLAVAPPMLLANSPPLPPPAVEADPAVAAAAADAPPMDIDSWEPINGSFLLEMVAATMDDGSGRDVVPTSEDVERNKHNVVKVNEMEVLLDVGEVQPYLLNGDLVVFLNQRPMEGKGKAGSIASTSIVTSATPSPELAIAIMSVLEMHTRVIASIKFLTFQATMCRGHIKPIACFRPVKAAFVSGTHKPPMVPPHAMGVDHMDNVMKTWMSRSFDESGDKSIWGESRLCCPTTTTTRGMCLSDSYTVSDVNAEVERRMMEISNRMEVLMAAPEPPMVSPLAAAPPMLLANPPSLPPPAVEADAAVAAAAAVARPIDIDSWEPINGRFLLEMVAAIMDDGSGSDLVPTAEDVERVLKEHGLFNNM